MNRSCFLLLLLAVLTALAGLVIAVGCGDEDDNDEEYECDDLVDNPTTDCDSVCTEETCTVLQECQDYVDVGSVDHCINECFKGCRAGCIPVGTEECLETYTDCESLIECLEPLFNM